MPATAILERFTGDDGQRRVIEALSRQFIIGSVELAEAVAGAASIEMHDTGTPLFLQGDASNDVYFILFGSLSIQINGRQVAARSPGQHVGEMATIDPHALRAASVIPLTQAVTAKVTEPDFTRIAARFPGLWRRLASEMAERIRQRSTGVAMRNARPQIFVGSSVEGLKIARAIQSGLQHDNFEVRVWTDGVFNASRVTVEDLENTVHHMDFGVLVLTDDDKIESRGREGYAPRDNVVLELGIMLGAVGRSRTLLVHQRGKLLKIPSDLFGITPITHAFDGTGDITIAMGPACTELRSIIMRLGAK